VDGWAPIIKVFWYFTVIPPSVVASYYHLGRALVSTKQIDKAAESLKKALELNDRIGGLSNADTAEAKSILKNLQKQEVLEK